MTREELDSDYISTTILNGQSETLEVNTGLASDVLILIDNGTTDANPSEYTLTERVFNSEPNDYQFYDEQTAETARSWVDSAWGEKMEFEFENTSGSSDTYRILVTSYRNLD